PAGEWRGRASRTAAADFKNSYGHFSILNLVRLLDSNYVDGQRTSPFVKRIECLSQSDFKERSWSMSKVTYVGMDVHLNSIAAVWGRPKEKPRCIVVESNPDGWAKLMRAVGPEEVWGV